MAGTMRLRIRNLRLRVQTEQGLFGADLSFGDGLGIIRAENSRGKSTAIQSILYALGLEKMVTTRSASLLTSAMRDRLIYDSETKAETKVQSSHVSLEIEGLNGAPATITRWVVDKNIKSSLVRIHHDSISDISPESNFDDYYVGRAGGATSDRGFHVWLAEFIGWTMPELPAREGRTARLYMEQVFPLLFVEQRRGWGGIQAQMPIFSGVTEVRKRAIEFLLDLDVGKNELTRQGLLSEKKQLTDSWASTVSSFVQSISGNGLKLTGLSEKIQSQWFVEQNPAKILVSLGDNTWQPLEEFMAKMSRKLNQLTQVSEANHDEDVTSRINEALEEARRVRGMDLVLREELIRDETEIRAIKRRITSLNGDLRQHQDIVALQSMGSIITHELAEDCPVCHQNLPDSLLPTDVPTMTATESVGYIKEQIDLFESMRSDAEQAARAKHERWVALRMRSDELNLKVHALREELTGTSGRISAEEIVERIELRERSQQLSKVVERFDVLQVQLEKLSLQYESIKASLGALPKDQFSDQDRKKLLALQNSFIDQLRAYDFGSFNNEKVQIGEIDYLPKRDNFDLQADISASDSVRVIWAYLLGLLEVSEQYDTNHPGLVVFDEPKQQSAKDISFAALLRRAGNGGINRQVIFATSEPIKPLASMLNGVRHTIHDVEGYLLKRIL